MNSIFVIAFFVVAAAFIGVDACKEGWSAFEKFCYKAFVNEKGLNWDEALGKCKYLEANLASVHSEEENKFIAGLITKEGDKKRGYWIGMRLERNPYGGNAVKGSSWSDGTSVDWADPTKVKEKVPWMNGEPNNAEGNEHCVHYYGIEAAKHPVPEVWNDLDCNRRDMANGDKLGAICKVPRKEDEPEPATTTTSAGTSTTTTTEASTTSGYGSSSTTTPASTTTTGYGSSSEGSTTTSAATTSGYGSSSTTTTDASTTTTAGGYGSKSTEAPSTTTTVAPTTTTKPDGEYGKGKFGARRRRR